MTIASLRIRGDELTAVFGGLEEPAQQRVLNLLATFGIGAVVSDDRQSITLTDDVTGCFFDLTGA